MCCAPAAMEASTSAFPDKASRLPGMVRMKAPQSGEEEEEGSWAKAEEASAQLPLIRFMAGEEEARRCEEAEAGSRVRA